MYQGVNAILVGGMTERHTEELKEELVEEKTGKPMILSRQSSIDSQKSKTGHIEKKTGYVKEDNKAMSMVKSKDEPKVMHDIDAKKSKGVRGTVMENDNPGKDYSAGRY